MIKAVRMRFFLYCLLSFCLLNGVSAAAEKLGLQVEHPLISTVGEPFLLKVDNHEGTLEDLRVVWLDKTLSLRGQGGQARLLLPTPLSVKEKVLPLLLFSADGFRVYSAEIGIIPREFGEQSLTVDPNFVHPPREELARIERERLRTRAVYASFTPVNYLRLPLLRPLPGVITGEFGVRRLFNKQPRSMHRGVDFRAAEGAEIKAVSPGRVALVDSQYYAGNIVIVDHGLGVYSSYMHMLEARVREGEMVEAGTLLGLAGKSGRVTGPHLHLGFVVQEEHQTPAPFMPDL
ncbi:MAG: M23 family metallopeptidase [Deltaproteobacteria bacterium]|jgi:murein DD-endopeptidase MepM/ murein hydrolase activator NlpD|nr:M23 family metallopeptidase [Deltaproteobacteria bacterium]